MEQAIPIILLVMITVSFLVTVAALAIAMWAAVTLLRKL